MNARLVLAGLTMLVPATSSAQYPTGPNRAAVVGLSAAYIASALFGAHIAIRDTLHEAPFGIHFAQSVKADFLTGGGTALSPGLPMLVVHATIAAMTAGPMPTSRKATHALGSAACSISADSSVSRLLGACFGIRNRRRATGCSSPRRTSSFRR